MKEDNTTRNAKLEKELVERGKVIEKLRAIIEYYSPQLPPEFLETVRPVMWGNLKRNCVSKFDLNKMKKYYGEIGALADYEPPMSRKERAEVTFF